MNRSAVESGPPVEERQLNHKSSCDNRGPALSNEGNRAGSRAARRKNIIDDQNTVLGSQGVVMNLQDAAAVFERVFAAPRFGRQFARLADRDEARAQHASDAAAKN